MLRSAIYEFVVDVHSNVHLKRAPWVDSGVAKCFIPDALWIVGNSDSSLIAIDAVVQYFDSRREEAIEWDFRYSRAIRPDCLMAIPYSY